MSEPARVEIAESDTLGLSWPAPDGFPWGGPDCHITEFVFNPAISSFFVIYHDIDAPDGWEQFQFRAIEKDGTVYVEEASAVGVPPRGSPGEAGLYDVLDGLGGLEVVGALPETEDGDD